MNQSKMILDEKPFRVGLLLVQRVPSSSIRFRLSQGHSWGGYLYSLRLPILFIGKAGRLIEVRTANELETERLAYRAQIQPGLDTRLVYYEVLDAGNV